VTKGTIAGMLAADMACGEDNPLIADMEAPGRPRKLPLEPFLGWGLRIGNRWDSGEPVTRRDRPAVIGRTIDRGRSTSMSDG
jgi:hypothetical protein